MKILTADWYHRGTVQEELAQRGIDAIEQVVFFQGRPNKRK
jgi:hypothetical protein